MAKKDKEKGGLVYSTNPDFRLEDEAQEVTETLATEKQKLYVSLDRRNRGGKTVTLIEGFIGTESDLNELGKWLKQKCGTGGQVKDGEILIQGEMRDKIMQWLGEAGYKVVRKGG